MATVMDGATITAPIVTVPDSDKDAIVNWIKQQEANDYESGGKEHHCPADYQSQVH